MEAPKVESIFECISDGVNKVLVLVLVHRTWNAHVISAMRCRDPAGQSEFFVRVWHPQNILLNVLL